MALRCFGVWFWCEWYSERLFMDNEPLIVRSRPLGEVLGQLRPCYSVAKKLEIGSKLDVAGWIPFLVYDLQGQEVPRGIPDHSFLFTAQYVRIMDSANIKIGSGCQSQWIRLADEQLNLFRRFFGDSGGPLDIMVVLNPARDDTWHEKPIDLDEK